MNSEYNDPFVATSRKMLGSIPYLLVVLVTFYSSLVVFSGMWHNFEYTEISQLLKYLALGNLVCGVICSVFIDCKRDLYKIMILSATPLGLFVFIGTGYMNAYEKGYFILFFKQNIAVLFLPLSIILPQLTPFIIKRFIQIR